MYSVTGIVVLFVLLLLVSGIKILKEYDRAVVFRLGRLVGARGPGIFYVVPFVEKMFKVSTRVVTLDVPSQDVITKDNVSIKVNAVVYFKVMDPNKAITEVENYLFATSQIAQTTLRSVCGQGELDKLLSEREKINMELQEIIDKHTSPWGIKVSTVEVKQIDLPQEMQRAMARQAEAERDRRAKVINAEGELQASQKYSEAAAILSREPASLQLRYLNTLTEIATENNSTIIFPLPLDMLSAFVKKLQENK
ncbi:MAG: slipin family protein [Deltaproteobacteria bacterium]|nr:slipin family protein [Deltaproteobacteria bacterium]MCL5276254.1 slipin family protein [Deltaproteobacteria bacterium]